MYNTIYFDIDRTIRKDYKSPPFDGIVERINQIGKYTHIKFITNNESNYSEIELYLKKYNIKYDDLITPFKNIIVPDIAYEKGYFVDKEKLYIINFPIINYELLFLIKQHNNLIYIIEETMYEDSLERGHIGENYKIPYIGAFIEMIVKYIDIKFIVIGKENMIFKEISQDILMIGDSNSDLQFAINNSFYFKQVIYDPETSTNNIIDILDELLMQLFKD